MFMQKSKMTKAMQQSEGENEEMDGYLRDVRFFVGYVFLLAHLHIDNNSNK